MGEDLYIQRVVGPGVRQSRAVWAGGMTAGVGADSTLSVKEVARLLNVSRGWVLKHSDRLPVQRTITGRVRIARADLPAWRKASQPVGQPETPEGVGFR